MGITCSATAHPTPTEQTVYGTLPALCIKFHRLIKTRTLCPTSYVLSMTSLLHGTEGGEEERGTGQDPLVTLNKFVTQQHLRASPCLFDLEVT